MVRDELPDGLQDPLINGVLRFADSVSGSYNFITALPVSRLAVLLREQGVEV